MLETPHVIIGAAIATKTPNPLISIPLAFASHFVLDMVPHWNPHINTELKNGGITKKSRYVIIFDVVLSLVAGSFIAFNKSDNQVNQMIFILLASFAAVLPDVIEGPYFFLGWRNSIIKKWLAFQKAIQVDTTFAIGMTVQIVTILVALWWIFS